MSLMKSAEGRVQVEGIILNLTVFCMCLEK